MAAEIADILCFITLKQCSLIGGMLTSKSWCYIKSMSTVNIMLKVKDGVTEDTDFTMKNWLAIAR